MKNSLQIFTNGEFGKIRTVDIDGQAFFVARDVAGALGYSNTKDAVNRHCHGVVKRDLIDSKGRTQQANLIPESDVYRLVTHSKLPSAQKFEKWIFEEVLPSIRKTGSYSLPKQQSLEPLYTPAVRTYQGQRVVTIKDISLATKQPEGSIAYWVNTKCRKAADFILLRGAALQTFKSENGLQGYLASRLYVVFESGFRKLCKMLGILPEKTGCCPALPKEAAPSTFTLDGQLQYADPESNPEIKSWIGHIRGHLDALDLLLYRYGDKHTAKAQEGLKYVLRDIGVDIVSSIHRLTKEKYALTTEY